ncbi:50S ribosomal protein L22 [Patescibacteria group bacterium]|nr:MAG: 50S ribosomal protein L22 [Patescibacteria group bacterium]
MDVHASLRYLRMAPRKVRLVIDVIRGMSVIEAETRLTFLPKAAALPVIKLLRSAAANAEHNFKLSRETLYVKTITVDGGPTLNRWRARAMGRAAPIRKRTSHITLILSDEKPAAKGKKAAKKAAKIAAAETATKKKVAKAVKVTA